MKLKRVSILSMLVFILLVSFLFTEVKNPDKPLKGEWDFKLKQVWKNNQAGEEILAKPRHLLVSSEGTIYLYDIKKLKYYVFSKDGQFVKSFAPKGEGPGEIKRFYNAFMVNDKLIVADIDRLHYFLKDGKYLKSVKNNWPQRQPDFFLNDHEFIHFPIMVNSPDPEKNISHYNLSTGKEKVLTTFTMFKGGVAANGSSRVSVAIPGLSPFMVAGYAPDKFYHGFNSAYEIQAVDYTGKKLFSFSLDRKKREITKKEKRDFFVKNPPPRPIPDEIFTSIIKSLPNQLTYFSRIEEHNKLIYVHEAYLNRQPTHQQIDIFSPEGKYLYRSFIRAPEGLNIVSGPIPVLVIKNDFLYITLEDEEGEVTLAKYEITHPQFNGPTRRLLYQ